jgi:hypothetical protein
MPDVPVVEPWAVGSLDLDPENARLPEDFEDRTQIGLLRHFEEAYDLEELAWSMAEHGYFSEEPLLTVPHPDPSRRIVVEGNRRLATLKLLTSSDARAAIGRPRLWEELAELAQDHVLTHVPIRNYASRDELVEYLGFRHVSGLLQWTSEAKARFVHRLIVSHGYTFERAGRVIGSKRDTIRRQYLAWRALEQGRAAGIDVAPATRHFGVYYRALQNPGIREFINLQGWGGASESLREPLGLSGTGRLADLLEFIFGSRRVIRDSRQLDDLARVLGDPGALAILREHRDLEFSLQELPTERESVYAAIRLAYRHAARANSEAWQFRADDELLEEATRLRDMVRQLIRSLEPEAAPQNTAASSDSDA